MTINKYFRKLRTIYCVLVAELILVSLLVILLKRFGYSFPLDVSAQKIMFCVIAVCILAGGIFSNYFLRRMLLKVQRNENRQQQFSSYWKIAFLRLIFFGIMGLLPTVGFFFSANGYYFVFLIFVICSLLPFFPSAPRMGIDLKYNEEEMLWLQNGEREISMR